MLEVEILLGIGLVWLLVATVYDFKTRDIPNWINFSLIIFALAFRYFYSLFSGSGEGFVLPIFVGAIAILLILNFFGTYYESRLHEVFRFLIYSFIFVVLGYIVIFGYKIPENFSFFYEGLIGVFVFFILSNLFYYIKLFAGGDTKLMISLGALLPIFSLGSLGNDLGMLLSFLFLFFVVGAVYSIFGSVYMAIRHSGKFKKGFKKLFKEEKKAIILYDFFAVIFIILGFFVNSLIYLGVFIFFFSYFFIFIKTVDEFCMVKEISTSKLTEGDWLVNDVRVGRKTINASWDGLGEEEIKILQKKKIVWIKGGLQFSPVFLISYILLWIFLETGAINFLIKAFGF